jgi:Helix-turn-helix.
MNLKQIRKESNLKITTIISLTNITRTSYYRYENELSPIPSNKLDSLAKVFKVTTDKILGIENRAIQVNDEEYQIIKTANQILFKKL